LRVSITTAALGQESFPDGWRCSIGHAEQFARGRDINLNFTLSEDGQISGVVNYYRRERACQPMTQEISGRVENNVLTFAYCIPNTANAEFVLKRRGPRTPPW
jgi:hypothetical protein